MGQGFYREELDYADLVFTPFSTLGFILATRVPFTFRTSYVTVGAMDSIFSKTWDSASTGTFSPFLRLGGDFSLFILSTSVLVFSSYSVFRVSSVSSPVPI